MPSQTSIPRGYTFLNAGTMVTTKGKELLDDLLKKSANRDPDAFDMYIYNDFFAYGVFDLVDKTLTSLHTKVTKKDWSEAYSILEALTVFNDYEGIWTQCDDGDRVEATNAVYGAMAITVLKGLKKEGRLDSTSYPGLESLLKVLISVGEMMDGQGCDSPYVQVARAMARRLFKDKTSEQKTLEKTWREEWVKSLTDPEEKKAMEEDLKKMNKEAMKAWFMTGAVADEDTNPRDFAVTRAWKEYKGHLAGVPRGPMRGPSWDISSWTAYEKAQFQFSENMDSDLDL